MKKGRKFQVGNHVDGFEDLKTEMDFVKFLLPDQGERAAIEISVNDRGELEAIATHGAILVRPGMTNVAEIRSEPVFPKPGRCTLCGETHH